MLNTLTSWQANYHTWGLWAIRAHKQYAFTITFVKGWGGLIKNMDMGQSQL